ncbi:MAG: hypothetical protein HC814_06275 [Rhodobacteraceae bacterium]|nr:hypothetical protein [Paracoccaceae bacterium]
MGMRHFAVGVLAAVALFARAEPVLAGDAKPEQLKLRAQLIWGTNDPLPDDPKHKEVGATLKKRLQGVFKWNNYAEINQQNISLAPKAGKRIRLSSQCELEVRDEGNNRLTVRLYGEKKLLVEQRYNPNSKDYLVLGDHDKNKTAWFVVLSRVKD